MRVTRKRTLYGLLAVVFGLVLSIGLLAAPGGAGAATTRPTGAGTTANFIFSTSSIVSYTPTFVGPAPVAAT